MNTSKQNSIAIGYDCETENRVWLKLYTGTAPLEVCYELTDSGWTWTDGDDEPDMTQELSEQWSAKRHELIAECIQSRKPQVCGTIKNSVTREQISELKKVCEEYADTLEVAPDGFYGIYCCGEEGDSPVAPDEEISVMFEVCDFDRAHDFDWLDKMLDAAGIELDRSILGEEPFTSEVTGSGECNFQWGEMPIYGYQVAIKN